MSGSQVQPGILACFEGGDAAGKSSLAAGVFEAMCRRGEDPVLIDKKSAEGFDGLHLGDRMKSLRSVLWDYPQEAPLWEWGDPHWFHLLVSWFSVLDRCRIQPLLQAGKLVIVDNWYYKFAARFLLKKEFSSHFVLSSFQHLTEPDVVFFVDVNPRVAVTRRAKFSATESGRMDGATTGDAEDFVNYQARVLDRLRAFAGASWVRFDATDRPLDDLVGDASEVLATAWRERLRGVARADRPAPPRLADRLRDSSDAKAKVRRLARPARSQLGLFETPDREAEQPLLQQDEDGTTSR